MVLLVHHSVSPQSRKARIMMAEKKILFVLKEEEPWNLSKDIQKLNFKSGGAPDSKALKAGVNNLRYHMEYIDWLAERNNYLAGNEFTLADVTAAAHLSILDYLGDVDWDNYKNAKLWYSKIKSRPSFKDILKDNIKGIFPSTNYQNLDF